MRFAARLLALCLAACVHHSRGLRNRAALEAALQQAPLPEDRQKRVASLRHWIWNGVLAIGEHGRELAGVLGKGSKAMNEHLSREDAFKPGCDAKDGEVAQTALLNWGVKLQHYEEEIMEKLRPLILNITNGPMGQPSIGDMMKIQKAVDKLGKEVMRDVPGSCKNVDSLVEDFAPMLTCMHKATNISKKCLRCVPRFFNQFSNCVDGCMSNFVTIADEILEAAQPIMGDIMGPGGLEGGLAGYDPQDVGDAPLDPNSEVAKKKMGRITKSANKMLKSMKKLAPCLECTRQKTDRLMDCFNLDYTWKEDLDSAMKDIIEGLKNGSLTNSMVDPIYSAPLVPLS